MSRLLCAFLLLSCILLAYIAEAKKYQQVALDLHNEFRAVHDSQPMTLNEEMSDEATKYAQKVAGMKTFRHSPARQRKWQGENIISVCGKQETSSKIVTKAVTHWYNEVCHYDFNEPTDDNLNPIGHFTQVVWNDSTELGIGKADVTMPWGQNCTYVVARYKPTGNVYSIGHHGHDYYKKNVKQGSFDRQAYCS